MKAVLRSWESHVLQRAPHTCQSVEGHVKTLQASKARPAGWQCAFTAGFPSACGFTALHESFAFLLAASMLTASRLQVLLTCETI